MFHTIGHTFELMKMSWRVLQKDRELIFFPIFGIIGSLIIGGIFAAIATSSGTLDRLEASTESQAGAAAETANAGDVLLLLLTYFGVYFVTIFFNAALIAGALERLRGGDPNIRSALGKASAHIPQILGWALIAATVGLILQMLRGRSNNFLARLVIDMIGGVWAFMTFFVVPVLVSEGRGPFGAIKRSASIVQATWGRQITASFGFMIVYIVAIVVAIIPALILGAILPILGIIVGAFTVSVAFATVGALEGIFKAALYEYALGEKPAEFAEETLRTAYQPDLRQQYM